MKKFTIMILAVAAMVGCSKEVMDSPSVKNSIQFGGNVDLQTKAEVTDLDGLEFSILRAADGTTFDFSTVTTTIKGTGGTSGAIAVDPGQFFNANQEAANFMAYYPTGIPVAGVVPFTIDGSTDIIVAPAVAVAYASSNATCALTFAHKLSQLVLKVKAADANAVTTFGNLSSATINASTKLDMTISAGGTVSLAANATPVASDIDFGTATLATDAAAAANKLMILSTEAPTKIKLKFAKQTAAVEYTISKLVLAAGKTTTITATVSVSGITFTSTVTPWASGGTDGDVTVQN